MKNITITILVMAILMPFFNWAQSASNKKYNYEYLNYPALNIDNAATFGMKVYVGDLEFSDASLKGNKARKILERYTSENNYVSFNNMKLVMDRPDILVEIAFGEFNITGIEIRNDHEIACKQVGAKLDSAENIKKNLKMCQAVYYKVSYNMPYVIKITNKNVELLEIRAYDNAGSDTFGYDSTGLTGFLKTEDLEKAYQSSGQKKIRRAAGLDAISLSNKEVYNYLFFTPQNDQFKFGTGKSKNYDYTSLTNTLDEVLAAFKSKSQISETLKNAIPIWESEIAQKNLGDKKSRINRKIATSIYGNLTLAYMYLNDFEKAKEYSKEYLKLANMAGDQAIPERARAIYYLVNDRADRYEQSGLSMSISDNPINAPRIESIMNNRKKSPYQFIYAENHYGNFIATVEEQKAALENEKSLDEILEENTPKYSSLTEKYRNRIQFSELQGNMLFLNNWYDKDLEGGVLPSEICELTELNELRPYGLGLTSIPDEIGNLTNLKKLDLSGNALTKLPSSIGNLTELKVLDLSNNKLTSLPEGIGNLKKLQRLKIKGNNISKNELEKIKKVLPKKCKIKS